MPRLASPDEEALRVIVEAWLRARYPAARIVHELVLEQGGCRIDLASVGDQSIRLVELKSKRDTLKRLPDQLVAAQRCAAEVWVALDAEKFDTADERLIPWSVGVLVHRDGVLSVNREARDVQPDPRRVADLLWRDELFNAFGAMRRDTRDTIIRRAVNDHGLTYITRRVCDELKGRKFPRADEPTGRIHGGRF